MDYYNLTVFEFVTDQLLAGHDLRWRSLRLFDRTDWRQGSARSGLGAGGGAFWVAQEQQSAPLLAPDVYAIVPLDGRVAWAVTTASNCVDTVFASNACGAFIGWHGQYEVAVQEVADASGAALVFGDDELSRGMVTVKACEMAQASRQSARWNQLPNGRPPYNPPV